MPWDETHKVETPEQVEFEYRLAGIGTRFGAALIDALIQGTVLATIMGFVILGGFSVRLEKGPAAVEEVAYWIVGLYIFVAFITFWGYHAFFEWIWSGQTLGKKAVGIRVVKRDGTPIRFAEAAIRNLVRIVDMLPGIYGVGIICIIATRRAQRLGDLAADTIVVIEGKPKSFTADIEAAVANAANEQGAAGGVIDAAIAGIDAGAAAGATMTGGAIDLDNKTIELLERYFDRRWSLEDAPRAALVEKIATPLRERLPEISDEQPDHDSFLDEVYARSQQGRIKR